MECLNPRYQRIFHILYVYSQVTPHLVQASIVQGRLTTLLPRMGNVDTLCLVQTVCVWVQTVNHSGCFVANYESKNSVNRAEILIRVLVSSKSQYILFSVSKIMAYLVNPY
ncbi:unnamed protein product [Calicophoron daubneyi]|uniref:Uncharacterized protein n=1 Tax=Calicophoron daubneyi TaxID=300641 RepID=A0AAV2TV38_CALDB